jgi:hypothetical protein
MEIDHLATLIVGSALTRTRCRATEAGLPDFYWYKIPKPEKCTK